MIGQDHVSGSVKKAAIGRGRVSGSVMKAVIERGDVSDFVKKAVIGRGHERQDEADGQSQIFMSSFQTVPGPQTWWKATSQTHW